MLEFGFFKTPPPSSGTGYLMGTKRRQEETLKPAPATLSIF